MRVLHSLHHAKKHHDAMAWQDRMYNLTMSHDRFEWKDNGYPNNPKLGWESDTPGASVVFNLKTNVYG